MDDLDPFRIGPKARLVLFLILSALALIFLRAFFLGVSDREERVKTAKMMGKKTTWETPGRASIRDRFNRPLAINRPRYDVGVVYSEIKALKSTDYRTENGQRVKFFPRKEAIYAIATFLGEELGLDKERIEDELHAKAALYNTVPYIIKEGISEKQYHKLLGEKNLFPALFLQDSKERYYPEGPVAGDLLGYIGAISREEYDRLLQEKEEIRLFQEALEIGADLPFPFGMHSLKEVNQRYLELEDMAFRLTDSVGKMGVEKKFEKELRGFRGKKTTAIDIQGNTLYELPGKKNPWPGKRILLSISSELQKEAEELLILREEMKETRVKIEGGLTHLSDKEPWIKGGAIIAMDPNTGEILAFASHPRIDPNDFISTRSEARDKISQYFELESLAGDLWDGRRVFLRERYDFGKKAPYTEEILLTWPLFLNTLLAKQGPTQAVLQEIHTVGEAFNYMNKSCDQQDPMVVSLLTLLIEKEKAARLIAFTKKEKLTERHLRMQAQEKIIRTLKKIAFETFSQTTFKEWQALEGKKFLQDKRAQEKAEKKAAKPYLDYLDQQKELLFKEYWAKNERPLFIRALKEAAPLPLIEKEKALLLEILRNIPERHWEEYLSSLRPFCTLTNQVEWKRLRKKASVADEKDLVKAVLPPYGFGFSRPWTFRQAAPQGSIFKLITAYTAIMHPKKGLPQKLNPLVMIDRLFSNENGIFVGTTLEGEPIPQLYKGGRIPRSISANLGKLDLLSAIEHSSNPYFSLLASEIIERPEALIEAAHLFALGEKTGIDLPGEIAGFLPKDLSENKTGLFATAIGQHTLVVTPLQTSVMLSALANGGKILKPQIVSVKAGKSQLAITEIPQFPADKESAWKKEALYAIGIDFPFILSPLKSEMAKTLTFPKHEVVRRVPLPKKVQNQLLEGMRRVMVRQTRENLPALQKLYQKTPWVLEDLHKVKDYLVGKTSTAEVQVRLNVDLPDEKSLYTHVWFGGILFEEKVEPLHFEKPELVIIVFLRFGGYGKEALPIACRIAEKWRSIKTAKKDKTGTMKAL